jgi:hypothetical protein
MSIVAKIRLAISAFGWRDGLLYVASRGVQTASFGYCRVIKYYFVAQPVPDLALDSSATGVRITTYRIEPHDPIVHRFPRPKGVVAKRFLDGAVCFVAVQADALVGFIWIKQEHYREDEVRCLYVLEPAGVAAWDFDVWVDPAFRLTRAFARLWDAANAFLRAHGYRWSLSRISAFNAASLASHRRLKIERLHSGLFVLVGSLQLSLLTCRPHLHLSLTPSYYPIIHLWPPDRSHQRSET